VSENFIEEEHLLEKKRFIIGSERRKKSEKIFEMI